MTDLTAKTTYDPAKDLNNMTCSEPTLNPQYVYESAKDLNYNPPIGDSLNDIRHKIDNAWICPKCGEYVWDGGEYCTKCEYSNNESGC